jgi:hypothetical protein
LVDGDSVPGNWSAAPEWFGKFSLDIPARYAKIAQVAFVEDRKRVALPDTRAPKAHRANH